MSEGESKASPYATCSVCKRCTKCDLLFQEIVEHKGAGWWFDYYNTLRCRGCETVFFQKHTRVLGDAKNETYDPNALYEWYDQYSYYPPPTQRDTPKWFSELHSVDSLLASLFQELYEALNSNLLVLSTIGVRAVLERSADILDIPGNMHQKLESLLNKGYIGETERQLLSIVKEAGNAAAHRAWQPKFRDIEAILDILEHFLLRTFVLRNDLYLIKEGIPPRP